MDRYNRFYLSFSSKMLATNISRPASRARGSDEVMINALYAHKRRTVAMWRVVCSFCLLDGLGGTVSFAFL